MTDGTWKPVTGSGNVEIRLLSDGGVQLRNAYRTRDVLTYTADEWDAFLGGVLLGEFDRFGRERT